MGKKIGSIVCALLLCLGPSAQAGDRRMIIYSAWEVYGQEEQLKDKETPEEVVPYFAAITSAIEQWEPRFRVTRIQVVKVTRDGELHVFLDGEYRPRAMYGDFTPAGARRIDAYANPDGVLIEERLNP